MPLITADPVIFDPDRFARPRIENVTVGTGGVRYLWRIGSAIYASLNELDFSASEYPVGIFKSTDRGQSWSQQDRANQPGGSDFGAEHIEAVGPGGNIIFCAYTDTTSSSNTYMATFDATADSWGSGIDSGVNVPFSHGAQAVVQSDGDFHLYYMDGSGLNSMKFSGSSWASSSLLLSLTGGVWAIVGSILDSSDRTHLFYIHHDLVFPNPTLSLYYVQIDASGSAGTPVLLGSQVNPDANVFGNPVIVDTEILLPQMDWPAATDPKVWVGAGLSSPSWTEESVGSPSSSTPTSWCTSGLDASGNPVMMWTVYDPSDGDPIQLWMNARLSGTWGMPELVYDALLNPPGDDAGYPNQFVHVPDFLQLGDGSWIIGIALETSQTQGDTCTGFALAAPAAAAIVRPNVSFLPRYWKARRGRS